MSARKFLHGLDSTQHTIFSKRCILRSRKSFIIQWGPIQCTVLGFIFLETWFPSITFFSLTGNIPHMKYSIERKGINEWYHSFDSIWKKQVSDVSSTLLTIFSNPHDFLFNLLLKQIQINDSFLPHNVWCIKNQTNHSSKTLMSLVWFLLHQTLPWDIPYPILKLHK